VSFVREPSGSFAPPNLIEGATGFAGRQEISGVVASIQNPGLLWTIEDSDNPASLLGVGLDGSNRGDWILTGATNVDWEDIASATVDGVPYIYVGDFGDNGASRSNLAIYRVREPVVGAAVGGAVPIEDVLRIDIQYPVSPVGEGGTARRDAEAMIADPANGDVYIFSKRETRARIFRLAYQTSYVGVQTLEYLGEMPAVIPDTVFGSAFTATGAAVSPDGLEVAVRTYGHVFLYRRPDLSVSLVDLLTGAEAEDLPADDLRISQWESIGFSADGSRLFSIAEDESGAQGVQFLAYSRLPEDAPAAFSVTVSDGALSDGPHPVTITSVLTPSFEQWRATQFSPAELDDPGLELSLWGDSADADGDGLPNLAEYALGREARVVDADGGMSIGLEGEGFVVRFRRRTDREDVTLRVDASADLEAWVALRAVPDGLQDDYELRRATLALTGQSSRWVRLVAERQ
jgi:hypothetical protein